MSKLEVRKCTLSEIGLLIGRRGSGTYLIFGSGKSGGLEMDSEQADHRYRTRCRTKKLCRLQGVYLGTYLTPKCRLGGKSGCSRNGHAR